MVGDALQGQGGRQRHGRAAATGAAMLEVRDLSIEGLIDRVSFHIATGETVGLAGLAGSGKEEVGDAIAGLVTPSAGAIMVDGVALRPGLVLDARQKGVGYVPRDRHRRGMVPQLSLAENLTLTITERLGPAGLIWPAERDREASRMVRSLEIVAASTEQPIGELSGGNQQKAVMGRALASEPKVLVVLNPMQGVDIASKEALFGILEGARQGGAAVLIVSDDLDELVACDRILVIFRGRLVAEFGADWSDHELVAAIEGVAGG
jgi:simple sugar transport system ATP-binding protein